MVYDEMKVSIAMATYNGARYLREQLESFAGQTRQPDELIITDDCSTDHTEAIIRDFAKTVPFKVRFHRNDSKLGYCGNFNAALMKTNGELVFLSDQDDVWFPEKIEHMIGIAQCNPQALVVMNDAALTDDELNEVGLTKLGQIRSAGLPMKAFVMGCCCAIRRELLDLCMPIPPGIKAHDNWIMQFAEALDGKKVCDRVLQYYRRHETNESHFIANRTTKVKRRHAFFHSFKEVLQGNNRQKEKEQISQQQMKIDGIRRVLSLAPEKYRFDLKNMLETAEDDLRFLKMRADVRARPLISRFLGTVSLVIRGEYRNSNGFKSVLRDLLG